MGSLLVQAEATGTTKIIVNICPSGPGERMRTMQPDFVLVRNECRGAEHIHDWRNALYGLMFANVPAVNSLHSIFCFQERPVVQAELNRLHMMHGDLFPVVNQQYFSSHKCMMYTQPFPAVSKVGHAHAGVGKMRINDHHDYEDFRSVIAMTHGSYCTSEPFVDGEYDVRLQKIGSHYRAYRRVSVSGTWKTNTGTSIATEIEVTETYRRWLDAAAAMFDGLDIRTVDAIHDSSTGQELILEVNGTSSGLFADNELEDNGFIRDLVIEKINQTI